MTSLNENFEFELHIRYHSDLDFDIKENFSEVW